MKPHCARLGHVGIAVKDLDRTIKFYTEILGLRLTERFDYGDNHIGHGVAVLSGAFARGWNDSIHHCLSIFTLRDSVEVPGGPDARTLGLHHIAWELDSAQELLALKKVFEENDVPIVNCRIGGPGNQPRFYGLDPDGNLLEFYWNMDHVGWDGRPRPYPPIQEIELEDFDFESYVEQRELMAAADQQERREALAALEEKREAADPH